GRGQHRRDMRHEALHPTSKLAASEGSENIATATRPSRSHRRCAPVRSYRCEGAASCCFEIPLPTSAGRPWAKPVLRTCISGSGGAGASGAETSLPTARPRGARWGRIGASPGRQTNRSTDRPDAVGQLDAGREDHVPESEREDGQHYPVADEPPAQGVASRLKNSALVLLALVLPLGHDTLQLERVPAQVHRADEEGGGERREREGDPQLREAPF